MRVLTKLVCLPNAWMTRSAARRLQNEKNKEEDRGQSRYQRYSVHRYFARAAGDLHDDHSVDAEGARRGDSATATAGYPSPATGSAEQDDRYLDRQYRNAKNKSGRCGTSYHRRS